jgi:pimeloyl-ACP methyl ester carboxylesterase
VTDVRDLPEPITLATGAEARLRGPASPLAVVCVNGGQGRDVPGTWSASIEWLVGELAPAFPSLRFAEVRYRIKSWNRLDMCVEDAVAAIESAGGERTLLVGFSMGGLVCVRAAGDPTVEAVLGLAPWLPDRLDLSPLVGKRFDVLHGSLDRWLPGIPGVSPTLSRKGFERARSLGVEGTYTKISGGVHGMALRARSGRPLTLPRAHRWAELASEAIARFEGVA